MIVSQQILRDERSPIAMNERIHGTGHLVLVFGPTEKLQNSALLSGIRAAFPPEAHVVGCSTAGEITGEGALDGVVTLTSLRFLKTTIKVECIPVRTMDESRMSGATLGRSLRGEGLKKAEPFVRRLGKVIARHAPPDIFERIHHPGHRFFNHAAHIVFDDEDAVARHA